jgi:hypothetical protein
LDLSVACELPYPDQDKPQIFKTAVVKNSLSPEFQFKQRVRIERKKPFERFLKAKKVGFDILRAPTWFLGSAKSIGKAELKVSDLINQSEVYQTVDVRSDIVLKLITAVNDRFTDFGRPKSYRR